MDIFEYGSVANQLISFQKLTNLSPNVTSEFNRKPRGLSELVRYKATEFSTFLLYLGPVVLKNKVSLAVYEHFLLLHFACSILLSERHLSTFGCSLPQNLMNIFVNHCEELYGLDYFVYNIHVLCHLSEEARLHGSLNNVSAFSFENYLGEIKRLIRSRRNPLQQLYRRLTEMNELCLTENLVVSQYSEEHANGPIPLTNSTNCKQYKMFTHKSMLYTVMSHSVKDAYLLTNDYRVMQVNNILVDPYENVCFVGQYFSTCGSFYDNPFESTRLQIFTVKNLSEINTTVELDKVVAKCMLFPIDRDVWVSFPLLH